MSMSACRDSITSAQGWSSEPAVQRDVLVLTLKLEIVFNISVSVVGFK